jgi:hypothetical protein
MLFTRWFCCWNRRTINSVPVPTKSWRRAGLRFEQLESRVVLDRAGLFPVHVPFVGPMAVQAAPLTMGFNLNVGLANSPAHTQEIGPPPQDRLSASAPEPPPVRAESNPVAVQAEVNGETTAAPTPGSLGNQLVDHFDAPSDAKFDGNAVGVFENHLGDHYSDPLVRFNEFPLFTNFRDIALRAATVDAPMAVQKGISDPSGHPTITDGDDSGGGAGLDKVTQSSPMPPFTLRQVGPDFQMVFASVNAFALLRNSHDDGTTASQRADGVVAGIPIETETARDDGRTLPEAATPSGMDLFTPEAAGVLLGSLPLGVTALARALRELQAEESRTDGIVPPYLRLFGLGGWIGSAFAYLVARQRLKRTTDFDALTALRVIALKNKDRA